MVFAEAVDPLEWRSIRVVVSVIILCLRYLPLGVAGVSCVCFLRKLQFGLSVTVTTFPTFMAM